MDLQTLTDFFMWCTILNGGLMAFWALWIFLAPDLVYRIQHRVFPLPRATWDVVIYAFLAVFKILFLVFNLVPFVALLMVG